MKSLAIAAVSVVGALAAAGLGAAAFVTSGVYNIGADDHHIRPVLAILEALRQRSIEVRSRSLVAPDLEEASRISQGASTYAAHCTVCHLAPGMDSTDVRRGMYPHPPDLVQENVRDPAAAFWVVKHGIKMSAMPSWSRTLDDNSIWDVVAFLRKMPDMNRETYAQMAGTDR